MKKKCQSLSLWPSPAEAIILIYGTRLSRILTLHAVENVVVNDVLENVTNCTKPYIATKHATTYCTMCLSMWKTERLF